MADIPISEKFPSLIQSFLNRETQSSCLWKEEIKKGRGKITLILMQVGETDGAKTRDAHKDPELTLIDGLGLFSLEKTNVLQVRECGF